MKAEEKWLRDHVPAGARAFVRSHGLLRMTKRAAVFWGRKRAALEEEVYKLARELDEVRELERRSTDLVRDAAKLLELTPRPGARPMHEPDL